MKKTFRSHIANGKFEEYGEKDSSTTQVNFRKRDTFMITRKTTNSLKLFEGSKTMNTKFTRDGKYSSKSRSK